MSLGRTPESKLSFTSIVYSDSGESINVGDYGQKPKEDSCWITSDRCERKKGDECSHDDMGQKLRLPPGLVEETEDATPVQTCHDCY